MEINDQRTVPLNQTLGYDENGWRWIRMCDHHAICRTDDAVDGGGVKRKEGEKLTVLLPPFLSLPLHSSPYNQIIVNLMK